MKTPKGTDLGQLWPSDIVPALQNFRVCWCMGRLRSGKTAIAFRLAAEYLKKGSSLYSNVRSVWTDRADLVEQGNFVAVLDEGGLWIEPSDVKGLMAGLGKIRGILIIPSVAPPPKFLQGFRIDRILNLYQYGLPAWLYKWWLPGDRHGQYMTWINPHRAWGVYDTSFLSTDDGGYYRLRQAIIKKLSGGQTLEPVTQTSVLDQLIDRLDDRGGLNEAG